MTMVSPTFARPFVTKPSAKGHLGVTVSFEVRGIET